MVVAFDALLLYRWWPFAWAATFPARMISAAVLATVVVLLDLRPRITVSPTLVQAGRHTVPTADIVSAHSHRRESQRDEVSPDVSLTATTLLAREGVQVEMCSAEGLLYRMWMASEDPGRLVAVLEDARATPKPPKTSPSLIGSDEHRGRRGASWPIYLSFLAIFAGILPWWVMADLPFDISFGLSAGIVALVAVPALRTAVVDHDELRSAHVRVPTQEVVAARTVPRGQGVVHLLELPRRNRSVTVWGPTTAIVCVTDPPGETVDERKQATHVVAIFRPVDLRQVLPGPVVDRRLPPAVP